MPHADWIVGRIEGQCLEPNGHSYHNAIAFLFAWNGSGDVPILRESGWFFTWKPLFNFQQPPAGQPSSIGPSDSRSRLRRIWWSSIWCSCSPRGTQSEFLLLTCLLLHHFCKKGNTWQHISIIIPACRCSFGDQTVWHSGWSFLKLNATRQAWLVDCI